MCYVKLKGKGGGLLFRRIFFLTRHYDKGSKYKQMILTIDFFRPT